MIKVLEVPIRCLGMEYHVRLNDHQDKVIRIYLGFKRFFEEISIG